MSWVVNVSYRSSATRRGRKSGLVSRCGKKRTHKHTHTRRGGDSSARVNTCSTKPCHRSPAHPFTAHPLPRSPLSVRPRPLPTNAHARWLLQLLRWSYPGPAPPVQRIPEREHLCRDHHYSASPKGKKTNLPVRPCL